jgi:Na+/H+-dicarboxylate symporter
MLLALVATAIGASIGTPATPGVGVIILSVVLSSVGVPLEGIALLVGVDRILELFRTATNVTGDLVASVVIDRFVSNPKTYAEEMSIQQQVEDEQEKTGEDVITKEIEPVGIPLQPSFLNRLRNVLFHKD